MTKRCGVLVAPYACPTLPCSSRRTALLIANVAFPARLLSAPAPCLPGALELIESHTMPLACAAFALLTSDPLVCEARTKGHSGLNHSRTTTLPL